MSAILYGIQRCPARWGFQLGRELILAQFPKTIDSVSTSELYERFGGLKLSPLFVSNSKGGIFLCRK
jgi:hypothetical protein